MIGIDIDSKNKFRLLKAYFNSASIAEVEVTSTFHGFHLRIGKRAGIDEQMQIRLIIGDCKGRVWIDELKIRAGLFDIIDTLFEFKKTADADGKIFSAKHKKALGWNREEKVENVLAPPFWEPRVALKRVRWKKWQKKQRLRKLAERRLLEQGDSRRPLLLFAS